MEAVKKVEDEKKDLETQLTQEKDREKILLEQKDEQIAYYKDLKTKMSTKMVGETLEQHCEIQFNQLRATAFRNAYLRKTTMQEPEARETTSTGKPMRMAWRLFRSCSR